MECCPEMAFFRSTVCRSPFAAPLAMNTTTKPHRTVYHMPHHSRAEWASEKFWRRAVCAVFCVERNSVWWNCYHNSWHADLTYAISSSSLMRIFRRLARSDFFFRIECYITGALRCSLLWAVVHRARTLTHGESQTNKSRICTKATNLRRRYINTQVYLCIRPPWPRQTRGVLRNTSLESWMVL